MSYNVQTIRTPVADIQHVRTTPTHTTWQVTLPEKEPYTVEAALNSEFMTTMRRFLDNTQIRFEYEYMARIILRLDCTAGVSVFQELGRTPIEAVQIVYGGNQTLDMTRAQILAVGKETFAALEQAKKDESV